MDELVLSCRTRTGKPATIIRKSFFVAQISKPAIQPVPPIGRARSSAWGGFGNLCCDGEVARSYSQLELVIRRILPSVNLGGETGNY